LGTRIEIVTASIKALEDSEKLLRVRADVSGDAEDARAAIAAEFEVSDIAADAIPALQVRRFTPRAIEQMRSELADYPRRLLDFDRPQAGPLSILRSSL
jgi:DNA gyrase/topoisomerase IV subunit A